MSNITMKAKDAISAKLAECFATIGNNRYNFMQAINFEANFEKTKAEVPILGKTGTGNKATGWKGTGSATFHYNTSIFREMMLKYKETGEDIYFEIQVTNEDPTSAAGRQTLVFVDCNIDGGILDNQTLDAFKTNGFEINNLVNGQTYYFALFPYADTGATNINEANRVAGTPQPYKKMTAIIDLSNSNPATCVTYADDAVGMTAGDSAWDEFFGHYPVLLKNGVEVGKLNPNNFDQFEDGRTADISSGNAGDAMIAFPRRGLTITTSGTKITISMTDDPDNADFEYNAHTRGTTPKDVFYLGVYKGFRDSSNKLRSLKGQSITASQTIGTFRTQAQANGDGYEQSGFYQLTFRQCMYILKYKNLNSQTTVGMGYVLSSHNAAIASGGTETWGMDCELIKATNPSYMTDQNHHVKCFGLEDFWGNIWEWIDGLVSDSSRNVLTANSGFNDSGKDYTNKQKHYQQFSILSLII